MNKTIKDIKCPCCKSFNTYIWSTNKIEFEPDGTGHYYANCSCSECRQSFRKHYIFKYEVTKEW